MVADRRARPIPRQPEALLKEHVRDSPAGIALAAGRHHIINFDADSACGATRTRSFAVPENASRTYDRNSFSSEIGSLPKRISKTVAKVGARQRQERSSACRVALIGFGTVGRAVAKILCESGDSSLRLTHICNRNVERKKQPWVPGDVIWTDDVDSVLKSDADIVIELIGGLDPAGQTVRRALEAGKSVVTANKQLIARHGSDLLQLARSHGCQLEFGASVAGGVPVLPAFPWRHR